MREAVVSRRRSARVAPRCPSCGAGATRTQNFCAQCGSALHLRSGEVPEHLDRRIQQSRTTLEAERKHLTILFADIVGSTKLVGDLDPEQAAAILDPVLQRMVQAVQTHGGVVTRIQGDGVMALFGAPIAQEDHASRACRAALDIRDLPADSRIRLRIGLHSGEVALRVTRRAGFIEYDATGAAVHLAARMEQTATPGTVRLTAATARLVDAEFALAALGAVSVAGFAGPGIESFELEAMHARQGRWQLRAQRGLGPFVNRIAEIAVLNDALRQAADGESLAIAVIGHPGTGKSRLVHEFASSAERGGWRVLEAPASSEERGASYIPFSHLLRHWVGADLDDPPMQIVRLLSGRIRDMPAASGDCLAPLCAVLGLPAEDEEWAGLPPAGKRRRIAAAVGSVLRDIARRGPVLVMIEDAHWMDPESHTLLDAVVEQLPPASFMLLVTSRPGYVGNQQWIGRSRQISVEPLAAQDCRQFLDALLGEHASLTEVKAQLAARTQGVPLFLEEMIRSMAETGMLGGNTGRYVLAAPIGHIDIPETIHPLLAARIDRLPARRKEILQVCAVAASESSLPLLATVLGQPSAAIAPELAALEKDGFLSSLGGRPASRFAFRHVLLQEATYGSMLSARRQRLHAELATAMEALYPTRLNDQAEALAHHAFQGGLWETAIRHLRRAAAKAIDQAAYSRGIRFIGDALKAIGNLPERGRAAIELEIELRLMLRVSLGALGRYDAWLDNVNTAAELARELGDGSKLLAIEVARLHLLNVHGDIESAIGAARRALRLAEAQSDLEQSVASRYFLAQALNWHGEFRAAADAMIGIRPELERLRPDARCGMTGTARLMCIAQLAYSHASLGEFSSALACGRTAWNLAGRRKREFDRAVAGFGYGMALLLKGEAERAAAILESGLAAAEAGDVALLHASLAGPLGCALLLAGEAQRALAVTADALKRPEVSAYSRAWTLFYRAFVCAAEGPGAEALDLVSEALQRSRENRFQGLEAWSNLLLGRIWGERDPGRAQEYLEQAARMADRLEHRPMAAHVCAERARVLRALGNLGEADESEAEARRRFRLLGMRLRSRRPDRRSRSNIKAQ